MDSSLFWRILRLARCSQNLIAQAQAAQVIENAALDDMAIV